MGFAATALSDVLDNLANTFKNPVEYIGITASVLIMASMCFPTNTKKSTVMLRILNLIGSAVFLAYGILLPAASTAILNGVNVIVNSVQLVLILRKKPDENAVESKDSALDDNASDESVSTDTDLSSNAFSDNSQNIEASVVDSAPDVDAASDNDVE